MTNYLITMPIYQARSEEIGDALIDNVISKYIICVYYLSPYQSAKNKFKKGNHKICRTFGYLQNSGSLQLPIDDTRWKTFTRSI